jgi:hypothetical protein
LTSQKADDTMSFLCALVLLVFVFFAGRPISAADQVVDWTFAEQAIDLYEDEALTIRWTGTHDVWSHSPSDDPDCAKATTEKKSSAMSSSWRTEAGTISSLGTHYFSCKVGGHCYSGVFFYISASSTRFVYSHV